MPRASALGVTDSVRLLGWRGDLPYVMAHCDWFILPRPEQPMEGFGLAVVEAQLAGLHMLLSLGIPDDPILPTASYRRLGLAQGPQACADAALALLAEPAPSRGRRACSPGSFALCHGNGAGTFERAVRGLTRCKAARFAFFRSLIRSAWAARKPG